MMLAYVATQIVKRVGVRPAILMRATKRERYAFSAVNTSFQAKIERKTAR